MSDKFDDFAEWCTATGLILLDHLFDRERSARWSIVERFEWERTKARQAIPALQVLCG